MSQQPFVKSFVITEIKMKIFSVLPQIILITSVYFFGRFNFSFGWVLPVLISTIFDESRRNRMVDSAIRTRTASMDQQQVIMTSFDDIPAWVMFPDVERAEWVNKIVRHLWPDLKDLLEQVLKDFEPKIQKFDFLSGFKFSKIDFGTIVRTFLPSNQLFLTNMFQDASTHWREGSRPEFISRRNVDRS